MAQSLLEAAAKKPHLNAERFSFDAEARGCMSQSQNCRTFRLRENPALRVNFTRHDRARSALLVIFPTKSTRPPPNVRWLEECSSTSIGSGS
jgi:hypothetical protein